MTWKSWGFGKTETKPGRDGYAQGRNTMEYPTLPSSIYSDLSGCVSKDKSRPAITAIRVEGRRAIATDGHQLVSRVIPESTVAGSIPVAKVKVPAKAEATVTATNGRTDGNVEIVATWSSGSAAVLAPAIPDAFPNTSGIIADSTAGEEGFVVYLKPSVLAKAAAGLGCGPDEAVRIAFRGPTSPIVVTRFCDTSPADGDFALVMPCAAPRK